MACITGKTFISQRAAERFTADNPDALILAAVPNLVPVEQMIGEWTRQATPRHEFSTLAVNSRRRGKADEDEITDMSLAGVISNPKEIA